MITYEINRQQLGRRLREARQKAHLTQDEFVRRLGKKTATAISEYENGKRSFSADELLEFSNILGVSVSFFFQDSITAEDDLENELLQSFRRLPDANSKRRMIVVLEQLKPLIIGEEKPTAYKPKRKG